MSLVLVEMERQSVVVLTCLPPFFSWLRSVILGQHLMGLQCSSACKMERAMDRCIFNLRLLQQHKTHCGNRHKALYLVSPLKSMASG